MNVHDRRDKLASDLGTAITIVKDAVAEMSDEFDHRDDEDVMTIMDGLKGLVPTLEVYQELLCPFTGAFKKKESTT